MDDDPHVRRCELGAGYTTEVRDEGTGPVVVFVHPTPLDRHVWDGVLPHLPGSRVIAYDLRGHGSAIDTSPAAFHGPLADDLAHLLDACDVPEAHVVGVGFGGQVGLTFALRHPGRLTGLTLLGARADPLPILSLASSHVRHDGEAARRAALSRWFDADALPADPAALAYARGCLEATPAQTFAETLETYASFDIRPRLDRIGVPTRVIATDRDLVLDAAEAAALARRLPGGEVVLARGAGPLLALEDPARFAALLAPAAALAGARAA